MKRFCSLPEYVYPETAQNATPDVFVRPNTNKIVGV